jgi:hypothetical protein
MMDATVPRLASSSLLFVFADRYVPAPHIGEGTRLPCSGVRVQTDKVTTLLVAFAFWTLREEGSIRLSLMNKKKWIFGRIHVHVDELGRATRPGIEGVLTDRIARPHHDLADIVCSAFGENEDPYHDVLSAARTPDITCDEIEPLEERFQDLSMAWDHFRRGEPDLHGRLMHECTRGIYSCLEGYEP